MAYTGSQFGNLLGGSFTDSGISDLGAQRQQLYGQQIQAMQSAINIPVLPRFQWYDDVVGAPLPEDEDYIELKQQEEVKLHNSLFEE